MLEKLYFIAVLILVLIGLTSIIQWIILKILTPKHSPKPIILIPMGENETDAELILRSVNFRAKMLGDRFCKKVIILDKGMDEETQLLCRKACEDFDEITVCKIEDLSRILANETE